MPPMLQSFLPTKGKLRTPLELANLKHNWEMDPCWDIETSEGFELHAHELKAFREAKEAEWERQRQEREAKIDAEADALGARGLYRRLLATEKRQQRLERALAEALEEDAGAKNRAYRIFMGYENI